MTRPQAAFIVLLLVLLPSLAARPLFTRWQIDGHDARYDAIRLAQLAKCVGDGQFSARWLPDLANGYGCPLFNFYSPFLYYLAEAFHLAGLSLVNSVKAVYALGFLASSLAMFVFGRELWGPFGGLLSAALYVLVPYRFVDIYVRSAFLEFFALTYPPLIFWAALRYAKTRRVRYLLAATLSHALLILTHTISAMLFGPLILLYYMLLGILYRRLSPAVATSAECGTRNAESEGARSQHRTPKTEHRTPTSPLAHTPIRPHSRPFIPFLASFVLSLALTAFFWLPALAEKKYIHSDEMTRGVLDYAHHFVAPWQILSTRWGFGLSVAGPQDAMSFQIGPLHLALLLVSLTCTLGFLRAKPRVRYITGLLQAAALVAVFLMLSPSAPLWKLLPPLKFAQFPWRFLMVVAFATSALGGGGALLCTGKLLPKTAPILLLIVLHQLAQPYCRARYIALTDEPFARPENLLDAPHPFATTSTRQEYLPITVKELPAVPAFAKLIIPDHVSSRAPVIESSRYQLAVSSSEPARILVNTFWFPGWTCYVDGQRHKLGIHPHVGIMAVDVPAGSHDVLLVFRDTPPRLIGKAISLLALILTLALCWHLSRPDKTVLTPATESNRLPAANS